MVQTFDIMQNSVRVHCDSQSAIHLTKDHTYHKRTKHIIRQWVVNDKLIDLVKISTKKKPANMMTKIIPVEKFRASLNFIKVSGSHVKSQKGGKLGK